MTLDDIDKSRAEAELNLLRAQFVSYAIKEGFKNRSDPFERLFDLAAAFAWMHGAK